MLTYRQLAEKIEALPEKLKDKEVDVVTYFTHGDSMYYSTYQARKCDRFEAAHLMINGDE